MNGVLWWDLRHAIAQLFLGTTAAAVDVTVRRGALCITSALIAAARITASPSTASPLAIAVRNSRGLRCDAPLDLTAGSRSPTRWNGKEFADTPTQPAVVGALGVRKVSVFVLRAPTTIALATRQAMRSLEPKWYYIYIYIIYPAYITYILHTFDINITDILHA